MTRLAMAPKHRQEIAERIKAEDGLDDAPLMEYVDAKPRQRRPMPWDVRLWIWLWTWNRARAIDYYIKSRRFLAAHARGRASRKTRDLRMQWCSACQYRYWHRDRLFCRAETESCRCGHHRLATLDYKGGLHNWECPAGFFGKGNDVSVPEHAGDKSDG